ncbi:hypothetical protein [Oryza sativa Japonica Group]|uniref:Uncharacterized protein n=1 Tax=Oryza sativa subsp. japonica TaxID=39947 RepID=Q5N8W1_ORYSJ|nr:hypothetical protein [Oryza sativa Japonica Group]
MRRDTVVYGLFMPLEIWSELKVRGWATRRRRNSVIELSRGWRLAMGIWGCAIVWEIVTRQANDDDVRREEDDDVGEER